MVMLLLPLFPSSKIQKRTRIELPQPSGYLKITDLYICNVTSQRQKERRRSYILYISSNRDQVNLVMLNLDNAKWEQGFWV
ncbi:hypothetical protein CARUB_v10025422mg [Capsella rubella]|uniref:Uncharacterized protein n=1 Tax=Capsella rubella TaxID=81985 RepID=R0HHK4_9BRAS|nr:hypothetical protein CARUB_v10025422mg [Capsella rubella]